MYYHEFVSQIAEALDFRDTQALMEIQSKAKDYMLDKYEQGALDQLIDSAFGIIEDA